MCKICKSVSRLFPIVAVVVLAVALNSCFTGVESTPKITYKDVKNNNAAAVSPEQELAGRFVSEPFSQWKTGKRFYVTSDRISLALSAHAGSHVPVAGDTVRLTGFSENVGLTGTPLAELVFDSVYVYRTNASLTELRNRGHVEIPFTIDLDLVDSVAAELRGRRLFVRTPIWFTPSGDSYSGRKFVEVEVRDVLPANEVYPVKVLFTDDRGETHALFMSAGSVGRWTPRDFASLFSLTDLRTDYPGISDEMWQNIVHTRPAIGMTKPEATLAIGTPQSIDRGHNQASAYERWNYTDGRYLVFEDGLLIKFNH